jgi:heat shock protein HtpX
MQALSPQELEAVLAHELTHMINRDVRTMVIAAVFAGIITLVSQAIFRGVVYSRGGRRGKGAAIFIVVAMAIAAIGYLLAVVIRRALSRRREFLADAGSVELTKNPDAMISALRKISGSPRLDAPEQVRSMFLDNPGSGGLDLFATHPPIERRIAALARYAGGKDATPVATTRGPWG